jgi:hypothetical protein
MADSNIHQSSELDMPDLNLDILDRPLRLDSIGDLDPWAIRGRLLTGFTRYSSLLYPNDFEVVRS